MGFELHFLNIARCRNLFLQLIYYQILKRFLLQHLIFVPLMSNLCSVSKYFPTLSLNSDFRGFFQVLPTAPDCFSKCQIHRRKQSFGKLPSFQEFHTSQPKHKVICQSSAQPPTRWMVAEKMPAILWAAGKQSAE